MIKHLTLILCLIALPAWADKANDHTAGCNAGDQDACLSGTRAAQRDGQTDLMMQFIRKGCALGNNIACSDLGLFKILGRGIKTDISGGTELIRKGCENGYFRACGNLGYLYYTGTGVAQNAPLAAQYYQTGCEGGSGDACENLSKMYRAGDGVPKDIARANSYQDRACTLLGC